MPFNEIYKRIGSGKIKKIFNDKSSRPFEGKRSSGRF